MAKESIEDTTVSIVYDLFRASGKGSQKPAADEGKAHLARVFAEECNKRASAALTREVERRKADGVPGMTRTSGVRFKGQALLQDSGLREKFKVLKPNDWVGLVSAAYYHSMSKQALERVFIDAHGEGWKSVLAEKKVLQRVEKRKARK